MPEVIAEIGEEYKYLVRFTRNSVGVQHHGAILHVDTTPVVVKQMWPAEVERRALDNWKWFKNTDRDSWSRRNEESLQLYKQKCEGERTDIGMKSEFDWGINSWRELFTRCLDSLKNAVRRKSRKPAGWNPESREAKKFWNMEVQRC